jgi:hypothetical protein
LSRAADLPYAIWWTCTPLISSAALGELITRRVPGPPHGLLPWLRGLARPARAVNEAGPTGSGLARRARGEGIELVVCAPGLSDRVPSDRIKTHRRDAIRLAWRLAAGRFRCRRGVDPEYSYRETSGGGGRDREDDGVA